jgi:tripartite-type tricarboxylate transporter receptor subunit TctC
MAVTVLKQLGLFAAAGAAACLLSAAPARAAGDGFPDKPITVVVPFAAGGPVDLIGRTVAQALSDEIGKPVIVENRVGAGGAIGVNSVGRAAADGYTLLITDISFVAVPQIRASIGYDPLKDFRMVSSVARSTLVLATGPKVQASSLNDFIGEAKRLGNGLSFGHSGLGSTPYLAALAFTQAVKIEPLMVSYRGMAPALNDLIAGQISAAFPGPGAALSLTSKGVHVLGVMGDRRLAREGGIPTFAELGYTLRGFEHGTWYGLAAPKATPDAIVEKLNAAVRRALAKPEVARQLDPSDIVPEASSPQEFDAAMRTQVESWKSVIATAGVKIDD